MPKVAIILKEKVTGYNAGESCLVAPDVAEKMVRNGTASYKNPEDAPAGMVAEAVAETKVESPSPFEPPSADVLQQALDFLGLSPERAQMEGVDAETVIATVRSSIQAQMNAQADAARRKWQEVRDELQAIQGVEPEAVKTQRQLADHLGRLRTLADLLGIEAAERQPEPEKTEE